MGYGARALQALKSYYSGEYFNLEENAHEEPIYRNAAVFDPVSTSYHFPITERKLIPD